jgi:hypothetical protein
MAVKSGKGKTRTIKPKVGSGQKPIKFKSGGLHESLGVPAGKPIPPGKMRGALNGKYGPKAASQARFAKNVLGVKTGTKNAGKSSGAKGASRGK